MNTLGKYTPAFSGISKIRKNGRSKKKRGGKNDPPLFFLNDPEYMVINAGLETWCLRVFYMLNMIEVDLDRLDLHIGS